MKETIDIERTANCAKMLTVIKTELVSALPTRELAPYFREIDAIRGSLLNRIRLEVPDYGTQEAEQEGDRSSNSTGTSEPSPPTSDASV